MTNIHNFQTQNLTCQYNPSTIGQWYPDPIPCEPIKCLQLPETPQGASRTFNVMPDPVSQREYKTNVTYVCNEANFAFDYPVDPSLTSFSLTNNVKEVTFVCDGNG